MPAPPTIADSGVTSPLSFMTAGSYYGYCTIADVQALFTNLAEMSQSANNKNVVAQAITLAAMELQGHLDTVYVMPYVGTDLRVKARLCEINAKWAAAKVLELVSVSGKQATDQQALEWMQYAHAAMMAIITGAERFDSPFGDATARPGGDLPPLNSAQLAQWSPQSGVLPNPDDEPMFTRRTLR